MKFIEIKGPSDVIHDHMILSGCTINNNIMKTRYLSDIADDNNLKSLCIDLVARTDNLQLPKSSKSHKFARKFVKEAPKKWPQNNFSPYTSEFGDSSSKKH
jgi:hypothetical protein